MEDVRKEIDRKDFHRLLYQIQRGFCFYCNIKMDHQGYCNKRCRNGFTIDHFIPKALGGIDHIQNYVLAHNLCNGEKGDSMPQPYYFAKFYKMQQILVPAMLKFLAKKKRKIIIPRETRLVIV